MDFYCDKCSTWLEKEADPCRCGNVPLNALARFQAEDAAAFLDLDSSHEHGWRWKPLDDLIGPQLQQELLIVAARPANGKTTFALNHAQHWIDGGKRVLYVGMEMSADLLRAQYAAWAVGGLEWKWVARRRWDMLPSSAKEDIRAHLAFQRNTLKDWLFFAPEERASVYTLEKHIAFLTKEYGSVDLVVVDHLHRMSIGGHADNPTPAMGEAVVKLKSLGVQYNTRMFVCAQLKRHQQSDVINDYLPSSADAIKQTGAAEQEANTILTLNRGMRPGISNAVLQGVRRGLRPVEDIALPGVMNVRVAKLRIDGEAKDKDVKLYLHKGQLYESEQHRNAALLEQRYGL